MDRARPRAQQCDKSCRSVFFYRFQQPKQPGDKLIVGCLMRFAIGALLRPGTGAVQGTAISPFFPAKYFFTWTADVHVSLVA